MQDKGKRNNHTCICMPRHPPLHVHRSRRQNGSTKKGMDANGRNNSDNNNQTTKQTTKPTNHEPHARHKKEENVFPSDVHNEKKREGVGRKSTAARNRFHSFTLFFPR